MNFKTPRSTPVLIGVLGILFIGGLFFTAHLFKQGIGSQSLALSLVPAPTVSLVISPPSILWTGYSRITWSSTNAYYCVASGSWSGYKTRSGSALLRPYNRPPAGQTYLLKSYYLTCYGPGGSATRRAILRLNLSSSPSLF